jgi:hypothetical protein
LVFGVVSVDVAVVSVDLTVGIAAASQVVDVASRRRRSRLSRRRSPQLSSQSASPVVEVAVGVVAVRVVVDVVGRRSSQTASRASQVFGDTDTAMSTETSATSTIGNVEGDDADCETTGDADRDAEDRQEPTTPTATSKTGDDLGDRRQTMSTAKTTPTAKTGNANCEDVDVRQLRRCRRHRRRRPTTAICDDVGEVDD